MAENKTNAASAAAPANGDAIVRRVIDRKEGAIAARALGGVDYNSLRIRSAAYSVVMDEFGEEKNAIVTLTVDKPVVRYVADKTTNEFVKAEVQHFTISFISLLQILRDNKSFMPFARQLQQNPKLLEMLLPGCAIDVIGVPVAAGADYTNPFTGKTIAIQNNSVYFEPLSITESEFAAKKLDEVATASLMQGLLSK